MVRLQTQRTAVLGTSIVDLHSNKWLDYKPLNTVSGTGTNYIFTFQ